MARPWTPDVALDDEIALDLIRSRFPELEPIRLQPIGSGWDNHAYLVNDSIVFRIPHRQLGGELMEAECEVLAHLNRHSLPLPIPNPRYVAASDSGFPYRIAGYPVLNGVTADKVVWTDLERSRNAETLGRFLAMLHSVPIGLPSPPTDHLRRADLAYRLPIVQAKLKEDLPKFRNLLVSLSSTNPYNEAPVWVHGDLYARHLIVDQNKQVCGVIDWGDVHVGDPALDLAIAWMFLPCGSHQAFKDAYGGVEEDTWKRARFRAMTHWAFIREFAAEREDEALIREGEFVYRCVMDG